MARSVTADRHITQVSSDLSSMGAAVLPMRRNWCRGGRGGVGDEIMSQVLAAKAPATKSSRRGFATAPVLPSQLLHLPYNVACQRIGFLL